MITPIVNPDYFHQRAKQVRARVPVILSKWGLPPKFSRWRLTQDPETGLVVLFGVLNDTYIAAHTATRLSSYFDPRLLHDLADDLQLQIVSCNSDSLRYAFILDRGSLDRLPTHIDFPFLDGDRLLVGVVYQEEPVAGWINPQTLATPTNNVEVVDNHTLVGRGVGAFLKVFDEIKLKGAAASGLSAQGLLDIVVINEDGFHKRLPEHKADGQRRRRIRRLFNDTAQ